MCTKTSYEYMLLSIDSYNELNKWAAECWRLVCCDKNWLYLERPVIQGFASFTNTNVDELANRRGIGA